MRPDRTPRVTAVSLLLAMTLGAAGSMAALTGSLPLALALLTGGTTLLVVGARGAFGNWACVSVLFCLFFGLYGLSGPVNALTGNALAELFSYPYHVAPFLVQQGHATIGLALGLLLGALWRALYRTGGVSPANAPAARTTELSFTVALLLMAAGSALELITLVRVGGLPVLAMGKAAYQSRAAELPASLPALEVLSLGVALAALWFGQQATALSRAQWITRASALMLAGLPAFAITLALGRRGPLFGWALMWIVGCSVHRPLRRLPVRVLVAGVLLVIASGVLFASRATLAYAVGTGDWGPFRGAVSDVPRIVAAVNPADSEFGAAFGNFSEYAASEAHERRWGATYIAGLSTLVPGALYPGRKPRTITYEFRDRHFPTEAARGAIAGTGFSSVLEAHVNFGSAGVLGVYTGVGVLLTLLERLARRSPYAAAFYLQLIPSTQAFHRSELSTVLSGAIMAALLVFLVGAGVSMMRLRAALTIRRSGALAGDPIHV